MADGPHPDDRTRPARLAAADDRADPTIPSPRRRRSPSGQESSTPSDAYPPQPGDEAADAQPLGEVSDAGTVPARGRPAASDEDTPTRRARPLKATLKTFDNGRYEVVGEPLGRGGFGTVYKVKDRNFEDLYRAIKTLNTQDIEGDELQSFLENFRKEANTQVRLKHPGIVTVHDYKPDPAEPYIVMDLVEGGSLSSLLKGRRLGWQEIVELGIQVAEALHYAHRHGVAAHRDIKPGNIFCPEPGRFQVGDFGIARVQKVGGRGQTTTIGAVGTPDYMAPEQILSPRRVDARSDQFSLAVVLYEALAGKRPFRGVSLNFDAEEDPESARRIIDAAFARPPDLRKLTGNAPEQLITIIERGLQIDPDDRYADCGEFADALREVLRQEERPTPPRHELREPVRPRPTPYVREHEARGRRWPGVIAVVAVLILALAGGYWYWQTRPEPGPERPEPEPVKAELAGARAAAQEALAEQFAAHTWNSAHEKADEAEKLESNPLRKEAAGLYAQAASEAWDARLRSAANDVAKAKREAQDVEAPTYSTQQFAAAESKEQEGERTQGREKAAEADLRAAAEKYQAAAAAAKDGWQSALDTRISEFSERLSRWNALPKPPAKVKADIQQAKEMVATAQGAVRAGSLHAAQQRLDQVDPVVKEIADLIGASEFDDAVARADSARRAAERTRSEAERAQKAYPGAAQDLQSDLTAATSEYDAADSELASAKRAHDANAVRGASDRLKTVEMRFATLKTNIEVRALGEAKQHVEARLRAAKDAQADAKQAGADQVPAAKAKYDGASQLLAAATEHAGTDPQAALSEAAAAETQFLDAKATATGISTQLRTAQKAITQAEAEQSAAQSAGALSFDNSKRAYGEGEQLLESARKQLSSKPDLAQQDAGRAADKFKEAKAAADVLNSQMQTAQNAITQAQKAQSDAKTAGALSFDNSKRAYSEGEQLLESARKQLSSKPDLAQQDAGRAADKFKEAKAAAEVLNGQMQTAQNAITQAQKAQSDAKTAGAPLLDGAKGEYAEAERLLQSAGNQVRTDPVAAAQKADQAAKAFGKAQETAASELRRLQTDTENKRAQAEAARNAAQNAGAMGHPTAKSVFAQGKEVLSKVSGGTDTASLMAAVRRYDEAIKIFKNAERIAHIPPLQIREADPPGTDVKVDTGRTRRFTVKASSNGVQAHWLLGDQRAPGSDTALTWEYRPRFDEAEGVRHVKVTLSDGNGQSVSQEWTVRVDAPNSPPRILELSPDVKTTEVGEAIPFVAKVADPDTDRGDKVDCRWLVDGEERGHGGCQWRWEAPATAGSHRVEVVARDLRGQEKREGRTVEVKVPDFRPWVDSWLRQYCADVEQKYRQQNESGTCRWENVQASGAPPAVRVSFKRVDRVGGADRSVDYQADLRCERGRCSGEAKRR